MNFDEYWSNHPTICTSSGDAEWLKSEMKHCWDAAIDEAIRLNKECSEKPYEVILHEKLSELKR